ncbi:MAG: glycosyltransferase [Paludibacter sp.]|nr:glycosyltransferase [Paludibacter sp.]
MKIIHFVTTIDRNSGGITTYLHLLSQQLKEKFEVIVVTGITSNPVDLEGIRIFFYNPSLLLLGTLGKYFRNLIIQEQPEIIHINGIWEPQTWLFQREAQRLGIKVVLSPHGMLEPYILNRHPLKKKIALALYQNKAIKSAEYLHVTAQAELNNVRMLNCNQPIAVIPNGIDTSEVIEKTNWNAGIKNILFLSRIHPKKGIELLIDAVAQLTSENFKITIAGEGDPAYVETLKKRVIQKNVSHLFNFSGGVFGNKKWELFQQSDLFILPTYSENFGIVIAEALATGIPVITTTGTPWQELEIYNCGWWIDLNVPNLVQTINQAINTNSQDLKAMGLRGKKLVAEKYTIEAVGNDMYNFYKSISNNTEFPEFVKL